MRRFIAGALAAVAATLVAAAAGSAATFTVQIRSNAFSPASLTVNHGDRVTFRNADKVDHQVVADDGSFASPILHSGRTWTTATLTTAGTFRYHDALHPSLRGRLTVKGPPPSVTLGVATPILSYGEQTTISGTVSSGKPNETVYVNSQPWGSSV